MSSDDLFDDNTGPALSGNLSPPSLGSTPIDYSGVVGNAAIVNEITSPEASEGSTTGYKCSECGKVLKTRSGMTRHLMLHKLNHYNARKPLEDFVLSSLPDIYKEVINVIEQEPAICLMGSQKKEFVAGLTANTNSPEVSELVETISRPIIELVLVRSKVMPSSQYEEALRKVNVLLTDSVFCESVKRKLISCVSNELRDTPESVLRRLVWRITTQFLFKIQGKVFYLMKERHLTAHDHFTLQEEGEIQVFKEHIEKILRAVFKFGFSSNNPTWILRCKCMRERFIYSHDSLSNDEFLNSRLWKEKSVSLSDPAFKLFLGIEEIIQSLQNTGCACNSDIVFDSLIHVENLVLLNNMRVLSSGILSEDLALSFLQDLIKNLVSLSGKLDANRKLLKVSKKQKPSTVSLRTNLKRNPAGPVEDNPDDPYPASSSSGSKGTRTTPVEGLSEKQPETSRVRKSKPKSPSAALSSMLVAGPSGVAQPTQLRSRSYPSTSQDSSTQSRKQPSRSSSKHSQDSATESRKQPTRSSSRQRSLRSKNSEK
ncbi:Zinc finger protein 26 [Frankliniella fusca]|uniref:Zinc finger protein 26 n=1 Tax=Frankliniella fusca TaxID=407009 RepID=A0AAE1I2R0_9NEOP|nr:Zinc finger protein 26 [Frankliniella fusca]